MDYCTNHNTCVDTALQQADIICRNKGVRFTELRRRILTLLWENHRPTKAYAILDKLWASNTRAKPPTVYRTLDFLLQHCLIHKLNSLNAYIGCGHPHKQHQCYFLICRQCGDIRECCSNQLTTTITQIADRNKFTPRYVALEIAGTCHPCRQHKP